MTDKAERRRPEAGLWRLTDMRGAGFALALMKTPDGMAERTRRPRLEARRG